MEYTVQQIKNILKIYSSIEEYEKQKEIVEAKTYLANTDYVVIKIKEYELQDKVIDNDYSEILEKREKARNVIRKYG